MGLNAFGVALINVTDGTHFTAYETSSASKRQQIGSLGGANTLAHAINDFAVVVGESGRKGKDSASDPHAFMWSNSKMTDLGVLGGTFSVANALNNSVTIVGASDTGLRAAKRPVEHAFIWDNIDKMRDLGSLGGNSEANSINEEGIVVGNSYTADGQRRACMWENGKIIDLNTLIDPDSGAVLSWANQISANGSIVGVATVNGKLRGFLLQRVSNFDLRF